MLALLVAQEPKPEPLKVCLISASGEYKSEESLAGFQKFLEEKYPARCSRAFGKDKGEGIPGLEALDTADVALVFARRITLPEDQLARVKKFCASGKPVVGVRTASHAFQNWLEFDRDVLGGNYKGHYGEGVTEVRIAEKAKDHPVLAGVKPFSSPYSLYKNTGAADDVEILLTGHIPGKEEPLAWTRMRGGQRIFYVSAGGPDDFKEENFLRLLVNGIFWAARRPSR